MNRTTGSESMNRRSFVRTIAALLPVGIAGCAGGRTDGSGDGTVDTTTTHTAVGPSSQSTADTRTETSSLEPTDPPTTAPRHTSTPASTPVDSGIQVGMHAAEATVTSRDDRQVTLAEYRGQKVMLWLFATWCPSCQRSAKELQRDDERLQSLTVLAGKMHENAGYSGPSVREFAEEYASETVESNRWVWGKASRETTRTFSPRGVIDIYYLIDEDGIIRTVDTVPGTTTHKIVSFANE